MRIPLKRERGIGCSSFVNGGNLGANYGGPSRGGESWQRRPAGRIAHEGERFLYTNLGDSYLLEFACAKWVQCAYSPPYDEEGREVAELEEAEAYRLGAAPDVAAGAAWEEDGLEGSWSCDPSLPSLW